MIVTQDLSAILFGQKYEIPVLRPITHPSQETLARYVGEYQLGPLTAKVTFRNGKLYVLGTGQPMPYALIATSDTDFYCNDTPALIHFVADEKGAADKVAIKMGDKQFDLTRVPAPKAGE
jgi:hypothetical protein